MPSAACRRDLLIAVAATASPMVLVDRDSGQATQRYSYTTFAVNGRAATTRLVIEEPDAMYAERLDDQPGVLYKVLSTSTFQYKGEDQTEYGTEFNQINLRDSQDLQPVLSFLKWLDSASDEEFASDLGTWVDIDSLATYIATHDVLNNFDSLSGPGHNGYLRYDLDTKKFSVVSWDLNLALSGFGGGGAGGGFGGAMPQGGAGGAMPSPPGGQAGGGGLPGAGQGGGGGFRMGNTLITRFNAVESFKSKVSSETDRLRKQLFTSGAALGTLDRVAASIPVTAGLTKEKITSEVERLRTTITSAGEAKTGT